MVVLAKFETKTLIRIKIEKNNLKYITDINLIDLIPLIKIR